MRKNFLPVLILTFLMVLFAGTGFCYFTVTLENGRQILLKDDGTWQFISEEENEWESRPEEDIATKATWQKLKSWRGVGIKNTEAFTITGKQWQIIWSIEDTTGSGWSLLQIFVFRVGEEVFLDLAANATGTKSDISYLYKSGQFYLKINSANGDWKIAIEELK